VKPRWGVYLVTPGTGVLLTRHRSRIVAGCMRAEFETQFIDENFEVRRLNATEG
jgi:hypothetical protein